MLKFVCVFILKIYSQSINQPINQSTNQPINQSSLLTFIPGYSLVFKEKSLPFLLTSNFPLPKILTSIRGLSFGAVYNLLIILKTLIPSTTRPNATKLLASRNGRAFVSVT